MLLNLNNMLLLLNKIKYKKVTDLLLSSVVHKIIQEYKYW